VTEESAPFFDLPWRHLPGYNCFGCCGENGAGLRLRFAMGEPDTVSCSYQAAPHHESYPGVTHGGIAATVLDELMGNVLALREGKLCFTVGMRTRFVSPLRTGVRYRAVARIVERPERPDGLFKVEGEICDLDSHAKMIAYEVLPRRRLTRTHPLDGPHRRGEWRMNLEDLARQVLHAQPFAVLTGTELVSIEPGKVELTMPIKGEFRQQHGFAHGGIVSYMADNAITFAGGSIFGDAVTAEYKINYVRPAVGDKLLARAEAVGIGKRQIVCRCDVFVIKDNETKLCATALGTVARVEATDRG
jgi:uncharacterized protein (TIGR00369 family)